MIFYNYIITLSSRDWVLFTGMQKHKKTLTKVILYVSKIKLYYSLTQQTIFISEVVKVQEDFLGRRSLCNFGHCISIQINFYGWVYSFHDYFYIHNMLKYISSLQNSTQLRSNLCVLFIYKIIDFLQIAYIPRKKCNDTATFFWPKITTTCLLNSPRKSWSNFVTYVSFLWTLIVMTENISVISVFLCATRAKNTHFSKKK